MVNEEVVETLTSAPYRTQWQPEQDGTYHLRLRARDIAGRHARTDAVEVVIGALPPEPACAAPSLKGLLWRECEIGQEITVKIRGDKYDPPFASWKLMQGDTELAACPDTAMKLQWTPSELGYQDVQAVAVTDDGTEYRSDLTRVFVYDATQRQAGPFLGQAQKFLV